MLTKILSRLAPAVMMIAASIHLKADPPPRIIPAPKEIRVESTRIPLADSEKTTAVILTPEETSPMERRAVEWLNNAVAAQCGKTLPVFTENVADIPADSVRIYVGVRGKFTRIPVASEELAKFPLGSQGYLIRSQGNAIALTAPEAHGVLYAAVTAGNLVEKQGNRTTFRAATVSDWPDFRNRMLLNDILCGPVRDRKVMPNEGHGKLETAKAQIEWALRYKFNLIQVDAEMFKEYLDCEDDWPWIRQVNEYAAERGIRILFHDYRGWSVGTVKRDGKSPDFKEGVTIFQKHFYTWSRNDLLERKAEKLRRFVAATKTGAVGLHTQDYWDGNFGNRSKACREKFGDDRISADANVINILYRGLKAGNPDILVNMITFPYSRNLELPGNEELRKYYSGLSEKIPADIWLTLVSYDGDAAESWRRTVRQKLLLWINNIPFAYGSFFDWSPRFFRSLYREASADDIVLLNHPYSFFDTLAVSLVGVEYQWNTKAPGYKVTVAQGPAVKEGAYYSRTLTVDGIPFDRWVLEHGTELPHPESKKMLQDICSSLYGKNIGNGMADLLLCGVTDWVTPNWRWLYKQNETLEVISGERVRTEKALKLLEEMRKMPLQGEEKDTVDRFYNRIYHHTLYVRVREKTAAAVDAISKKDFARAEKLAAEAEKQMNEHLDLLHDRVHARWIYSLNTDTWYKRLKQDMYFLRLKMRFSKDAPAGNSIRVAVYNPAGRGGEVFPFKTIYNTLIRNRGISVEYIDNLRPDTLEKFKALVIPQVLRWGDGDASLYRASIRKFVSGGGGVYFEHDSNGWKHPGRSVIESGVFPEICKGILEKFPQHPGGDLAVTVMESHPALNAAAPGTVLPQMYWDHMVLIPGPEGKVLLNSASGKPVLIAGSFGRGRVLCSGMVTLKKNDQEAEIAEGVDKTVLDCGIPWLTGNKTTR